jgi:cold shock CspA family protein
MRGRISRYLPDRGFGFLSPTEGGPQTFFHINQWKISGIGVDPMENMWLEWEIGDPRPNGKVEAVRMRLLSVTQSAEEEAWATRADRARQERAPDGRKASG